MRKLSIGDMTMISPETVPFFPGRLASKTPDHLMEAVGISLDTWNKICRGAPIRRTLAVRVMRRLDALQNAALDDTRKAPDQPETWDQ